jgi:hypothetical protein
LTKIQLPGYGAVQFRPMKRLRRWLLNGLLVASLLLCPATAGLWVYSELHSTFWTYTSELDLQGLLTRRYLGSSQGRLTGYSHIALPNNYDHLKNGVFKPGYRWFFQGKLFPDTRSWSFHFDSDFDFYTVGFLGFYWKHQFDPMALTDIRELALPYWFLFAISLVLPIRWWLKARRTLPGCCTVCGYDLRASKDRCPECGTAIPAGTINKPLHESPPPI